eukprot:m.73287 g.73287  ORF g.73287 m.73287 type:complete len:351 (-) comp20329_c2_seq1:18-1070(-)
MHASDLTTNCLSFSFSCLFIFIIIFLFEYDMGKDFYAPLELTRAATTEDVQKQYRILAKRYHPDANHDETAPEKFLEIAEAFDVLGNAERRAIYDQYGSEGLRQGVPDQNDGFTEGYVFHNDANKVFRDFFGTDNPLQDVFPPVDEYGLAQSTNQRTRLKQDPPVVQQLMVTLEEVFAGCVKKFKISRKVLNEDGHTTTIRPKILTIDVQKGWKEGTRITFPKDYNQGPNNVPADVVFVLTYKKHPRFTREGNNLIHTAKISLAHALTGCVLPLVTLDGRQLNIPVNQIVSPGYEQIVTGEGMPNSKDPSQKGDLILRFETIFPTTLTENQKKLIEQALPQNQPEESKRD